MPADDIETNRKDSGGNNLSQNERPNGISGQHHVSLRERVTHFTWEWFSANMATGSLAVVLAQTPNRFTGLTSIGKIVFITDLVLFLLFTTTIAIRFIMRPSTLSRSLHHPQESLFFGSFWVSISLILQNTQLYGVPSCGTWIIRALHACFWIYASLALLVAIFQYHTLFVKERLQVAGAIPAWIMPGYPLLVTGPLASLLIPGQPASARVPIFIGGLMFQGLGWMVSIFMYSIYTQRLMGSDLPAPPQRPGMYISVGPAGKSFEKRPQGQSWVSN